MLENGIITRRGQVCVLGESASVSLVNLYEVNLFWPTDSEPRISYNVKDSLRKKLFDYQTVMNGILWAKEKTVLNNE